MIQKMRNLRKPLISDETQWKIFGNPYFFIGNPWIPILGDIILFQSGSGGPGGSAPLFRGVS